jgi:hypothetical protein
MEKKMELYLVHCGFYDPSIGDGIFESHINLFIAGDSFEDARKRVREHPEFKKRGLHIDGFQRIEQVQGFSLHLSKTDDAGNETRIVPFSSRDMTRTNMPHN